VNVGYLDFAATESSTRELFGPYGNVERVNLVTDRDTGRSRGFAFVEMTEAAKTDRAVAGLNGPEFEGSSLNVDEACPTTEGGGDSGFSGGTARGESVGASPAGRL
jgi:RNA recognition motif-containing protein